jgi:cell division protein FtsL
MEDLTKKKKQYRRLKHSKNSYEFYIACNNRPDLENKILKNVNEYVDISQKYKNKGHTRDEDIKMIEKEIKTIKKIENVFYIELYIHVHHYSYIVFDLNNYLSSLNELLKLPTASIFTQHHIKKADEFMGHQPDAITKEKSSVFC